MTGTTTAGMCTDEAAFLRAICENPEDDLPRLVFADWLEERDDTEQAEKIRRMIATGEEDVTALRDDGTWETLIPQEEMHGVTPIELREMCVAHDITIGVFKRGFLEQLYCGSVVFERSGTGQVADGVFYPDRKGFVERFHEFPITRVIVPYSFTRSFDYVRRGRSLAGLKAINLPYNKIDLWHPIFDPAA